MTLQTAIWKNLVQESEQLKRPTQVHQLLNANEISEINTLIIDIINQFLEKGEYHIGLKTYVNQELNLGIATKMAENPPKSNQDIGDWCKEIFGDDKFGMVLNTLEGYSNTFAELAAKLVSPLLKEAGLPLEGLSFLFFMGNYGFTPFGIHKESKGEEGVLFHLGPGKKTFYTWDTPEYNAIEHYTEAFRNIDEMLPLAKANELKSGDAMFIPHQVFHIANSSEFSLSFVMDYINPPTDRFENDLLQEASNEGLYLNTDYQPPLQSEFPYKINRAGLLEKIDIAYKRRLLTLRSNAGILRKSLVNGGLHMPNGIFSVKGKPIFPVLMDKQADNQVIVFARGHRFIKPSNPNLQYVVDVLNGGDILSIDQISSHLEPKWDVIEIFSFIGDLLQVEAIEVVS